MRTPPRGQARDAIVGRRRELDARQSWLGAELDGAVACSYVREPVG